MTIIWSAPPILGSTGGAWSGFSVRVICIPVISQSYTYVRVGFLGPPAGGNNMHANHVAIAHASATQPNATATPVELKFGGSSGFNVGTITAAISDWLSFPITTADNINGLLVIIDLATGADIGYYSGDPNFCLSYWKSGSSFSTQNVTGYTADPGGIVDTAINIQVMDPYLRRVVSLNGGM
jgi:hypothetical protein